MKQDYTLLIILAFVVTALAGFAVGSNLTCNQFKAVAIQHKAAHYDAETGDFKWNNQIELEKK